MEESEKIKLESFIEEVGSHKGRHTELVTVYIPAGYSLSNVVRQIEQEKSTASNIKSKNTRKAVLDSLEKIERQLKLIGRTPENGMAIFAGNISPTEGVEQIEMWTIEPPVPLKTRLYRCDQDFVLEPLKEMLEIGDLYGLLVIDRKDAAIGLLEGKQIKVLKKLTSGVPSKVRAGGQSSQRFHRVTEGLAKEFFRRVAEDMKEMQKYINRIKKRVTQGFYGGILQPQPETEMYDKYAKEYERQTYFHSINPVVEALP